MPPMPVRRPVAMHDRPVMLRAVMAMPGDVVMMPPAPMCGSMVVVTRQPAMRMRGVVMPMHRPAVRMRSSMAAHIHPAVPRSPRRHRREGWRQLWSGLRFSRRNRRRRFGQRLLRGRQRLIGCRLLRR
jgi:hypothetical protein